MKAKDKLKAPPAAKVTHTKCGAYVGRRMTTDNKLAHFWHMDGEEKPKGWTKQLVPAQIGERFRFSYDGTSVYTSGEHRPAQLQDHAAQGLVDGWIAEDQIAYQRDLEQKSIRAMKNRESQFDQALEPIRRILDTVNSHADRAALVDRISVELMRRRPKK